MKWWWCFSCHHAAVCCQHLWKLDRYFLHLHCRILWWFIV